jgi:chromosome condensin MukBEF MukE localization factor
MSSLLIALLVFVVVALATFVGAALVDQRRAQARLIRDRLAAVHKSAEREPAEELALLRDEQLSKIPALDSLLRRSARVSAIQDSLLQAGMKFRAGNFLLM